MEPSPNVSHPFAGIVLSKWQKIRKFAHKRAPPEFGTAEPDELGELNELDKLDELEVEEIGKEERAVKANWNQHQIHTVDTKKHILQRSSELKHVQISPCN